MAPREGNGCANPALEPGEGFLAVPGGRVGYRVVGAGRATPLLVLVLHGYPGMQSYLAMWGPNDLREAETAL